MSSSTAPTQPLAAPGSFTNRTILITGGAGTIGRVLSTALAQAGANILINDLGTSPHHTTNPNPAQTLAAELTSQSLSAIASNHNIVTSAPEIIALAISNFGRLDAIINCAGIHPYLPFSQQDAELCRTVLETNVLGPMAILRAAWPYFKTQNYGRVVNFTSDGIFGLENSAAYVASKGALLGLTRSLAMEGKEIGVCVNAVAPVAYPPMVMSAFEVLPVEQREWFKETFTPESNVPGVLALVSEGFDVTGEVFEVGGWALGRMVLGCARGVGGVRTMEDALSRVGDVRRKGEGEEVFEPKDVGEFLRFKTGYM